MTEGMYWPTTVLQGTKLNIGHLVVHFSLKGTIALIYSFTDWQPFVPMVDEEEFKGASVQLVCQYLDKLHRGKNLDKFMFTEGSCEDAKEDFKNFLGLLLRYAFNLRCNDSCRCSVAIWLTDKFYEQLTGKIRQLYYPYTTPFKFKG